MLRAQLALAVHAAGFVLRRFAITNAHTNMTAANAARIPIEIPMGKIADAPGKIRARNASLPYVTGLICINTRIHPEAPLNGNNAPDNIQSGSRNRFTIA